MINNRLLTAEDIRQKFKMDFITSNSLANILPKEWIKIINQNRETIQTTFGAMEKIIKYKKSAGSTGKVSQKIYRILVEEEKIPGNDKAKIKWEIDFNLEINDTIWSKSMSQVMQTTNCSKLRLFQFRLTNRYLVTNVHRNKWDSTVTSNCYFCNQEKEDYVHLFVECKIVKKLWTSLKKWLKYFFNVDLEICPYDIILNKYRDAFQCMTNTIILISKQYIYATKCLGNTLSFQQLIRQISRYKGLEETQAKKRDTLNKHENKWLMYDTV